MSRALAFDLEDKAVQLTTAPMDVIIEADEQLLRQVLFNLLINAVQAVPAGGEIHDEPGGEVHREVGGTHDLAVTADDTGNGQSQKRPYGAKPPDR